MSELHGHHKICVMADATSDQNIKEVHTVMVVLVLTLVVLVSDHSPVLTQVVDSETLPQTPAPMPMQLLRISM